MARSMYTELEAGEYVVACKVDDDEGATYRSATSKRFDTFDEARLYAVSIAKTRAPVVLKVLEVVV